MFLIDLLAPILSTRSVKLYLTVWICLCSKWVYYEVESFLQSKAIITARAFAAVLQQFSCFSGIFWWLLLLYNKSGNNVVRLLATELEENMRIRKCKSQLLLLVRGSALHLQRK